MTPACLLLLLLAPLTAQEESEAAQKAKKDLAAIKTAVGQLAGFRPKAQELQSKMRSAATPEEQQKLRAEFEKLGKEFQALRDKTVKQIDALIASTTTALEKTPENAALLEARSEANTLMGKNDAALDDLEKLAALRKDDVDLQMRVAGLQQRMNRYEAALASIEKVLEKKPDDTQSRAIQGLCLYAVHRFEEANTVLTEVLKKEDLDPRQRQAATQQNDAAKSYVELWKKEQELRKKEAEVNNLPQVRMTTSRGVIEIELFENEAPNTVANFIELVTKKFYDGLKFHRIIPNFMAQGGCPKGNGSGDPGYSFKDELGESHRKHFRGSLSMANSGPNTNGSQFFITHLPTHWLNGRHTVFGRVTKGQEFVDGLQVGDTITTAEVIRKRDHEYSVKKMGAEKKEENKGETKEGKKEEEK